MINRTLIASALLTITFAAPGISRAQSIEQMVQSAVTSGGEDCPKVTNIKVLGMTEDGRPFIAAACSNGTRYVLEILPNDTLEYLSTCSIFEAVGKTKCF